MLLKLDGDRADPSAVLVVVTETLGEHQVSRDVEMVLDDLKLTIQPSVHPPHTSSLTSLTAHSVLPGADSSLIP